MIVIQLVINEIIKREAFIFISPIISSCILQAQFLFLILGWHEMGILFFYFPQI